MAKKPLSEVWCNQCAEPSVQEYKGKAYCEEHLIIAKWHEKRKGKK